MHLSPILILHICAGTIGCLSGFAAVWSLKGSRRHALAGMVFVISMLSLAASGGFLAVLRSQPTNVLGGVLTFYLVATAWISARRKEGKPGIFDWIGLMVVVILAAFEATWGSEAAMSPTGMKYGYPVGPYLFIGSVAVLATIGDVRMLMRGGISGTQRIARHLWRMCFAWFIASASIFLARQQLFPAIMRRTGALFLLSFLPLMLMILWLIRIRFKSVSRKMGIIAVTPEPAASEPVLSIAVESDPPGRFGYEHGRNAS